MEKTRNEEIIYQKFWPSFPLDEPNFQIIEVDISENFDAFIILPIIGYRNVGRGGHTKNRM
jgi:hypothetical protein